ncbi:acyltransferase family protein [Duganella sp. P38]|uniref:acyltransferase family protein n=1 Tax=Duganella sp. P38 TaxID=3423949 RepID=UPI003D797A0D
MSFPHSPASHLSYRPDIDGLRALAVLPVVLFHMGVPGFGGGFIGVDVFFVISGYLITSIIVRDLQHNRFSIGEFYRRRVLRIFPALFTMLAVVSVGAAFVLLPGELVRYGKALAATAGFSSNFVFYLESGYFERASDTKLLLHTWSLAVEEQFYLFWPLILAGLHARALSSVRWISLIITAASFAFAVWLLKSDPSAAFFLIPTRAWELMVGALIAVMPVLPAGHRWLREALAGGGIIAILIGVKTYNAGFGFPGPAALLPCLAAAAIIVAGSSEGGGNALGSRLLAWRPVVFVGKISFSLYLWHWPVIVFAQIGLLREQNWSMRAIELAASFALAYLSWRYVETPIRNGGVRWPTRRIICGAALAMSAAAAVGIAAIVEHGMQDRYTKHELTLASYEDYNGDQRYRGGSCFVIGEQRYDDARCLARNGERPSVLLLGDSHAAHLWPGLNALGDDLNILQATHTGCRPLLTSGQGGSACQRFTRNMLSTWLPQHPVDTVLLAGRWERADLARLPDTIAAARQYAKHVIVVGPIPQYAAALPRFLVRQEQTHDDTLTQRGLVNGPLELDPQMRKVAINAGATYVSLFESLCQQRRCVTMAGPDEPLQFDYGHLTAGGSKLVTGLLMPSIRGAAPAAAVGQQAKAN